MSQIARKAFKKDERLLQKRYCISDAKSAIRWFKQHANELGIDPKRIIAGGGSSGGHVCLLATTNPGLNDPNDPKKTPKWTSCSTSKQTSLRPLSSSGVRIRNG